MARSCGLKARTTRPQASCLHLAFNALIFLLAAVTANAQVPSLTTAVAALPVLDSAAVARPAADWLIVPETRRALVARSAAGDEIIATNGLIRRVWRVRPAVATMAFDNLTTGASLLRAVRPEALVTIDGTEHAVGGLLGQPDQGYLSPQWLAALAADPAALRCVDLRVGLTEPRFTWKRVRHSADLPWPPRGVALHFHFRADGAPRGVEVTVHYELYDGLPLLCKWITVTNAGDQAVTLNTFTSEVLAAVESDSSVEARAQWAWSDLHVESDYAFLGGDSQSANRTTCWVRDPTYVTQVNYELNTPCLLLSRPPLGPEQVLAPGASLESFRTFELVLDATDRERRGLAQRRMYRTIAPWVTENPIMMHVRSAAPDVVRAAIDQCAAVGFEMVILSFGSGFDLEDRAPETLARAQEYTAYARDRGIEIGCYSLLASRSLGPETDVIDARTGLPGGAAFGASPCLGSTWGQQYFDRLYQFYADSGFTLLEHDGSYPGDICAAANHPGHRGRADSQWTQWRTITDFYKWCRGRGIYLNVPDYYYLAGSTKCAMGYRETNWSLPREQQFIHARQNIYDGTWTKTPSMGWMFVPLTEYQGGGAAATLEPLAEHLDDYEQHLALNFGLGVQACYRGPRLYDTDATRELVKRWVDFFKRHRDILESDLIHVRRADGRDVDCLLHVNPRLAEKGLALVFNPLPESVERELVLPLYYTGLRGSARIREQDNPARPTPLDAEARARVRITLPPCGVTWLAIE